jgi:proteasome lid subunit RPN8/RPN11
MYLLPIDQAGKLVACVNAAFPREAAGLLLRQESRKGIVLLSVVPLSPTENTPFSFRIRDASIDDVEKSLANSGMKVCGCFHSHVFGPARPSKHDCAALKCPGDLWFIHSVRFRRLRLFLWDGRRFRTERFRIALSASPLSA